MGQNHNADISRFEKKIKKKEKRKKATMKISGGKNKELARIIQKKGKN